MAIYHMEAKIVSRGAGRSAVAAAAYMSCSQILNDYDGVLHDFTRKRGLVWAQTFLPENAPAEWADRAVLWNAVEEHEKTKDSRLAREFAVALPIEMERNQWIELLTESIQTQFVSDGMCADTAIHDTNGHTPHTHILLTVRPLNSDGTWQYKTQKEYLRIRGREERGFTAEEFKAALAEELEDLRTEKNRILASFNLTEDKDMNKLRRWTKQQEAAIQTLNAQESRCQTELNTALEEYKTLSTHAANFDA